MVDRAIVVTNKVNNDCELDKIQWSVTALRVPQSCLLLYNGKELIRWIWIGGAQELA